MIRAILFDFYSVWVPDVFEQSLALAEQAGPQAVSELAYLLNKYYHGSASLTEVADTFRYKLSRPDIDTSQFTLREQDISPAVAEFLRNLHGHFLKLGVLANLGIQEYELLTNFNDHNQLLEVIAGPLPFKLDAPLLSQEVFARALQTIGEPPRSCLVITGHADYQAFANSLGISTLPFEGLPKLQKTLEELLANETA